METHRRSALRMDTLITFVAITDAPAEVVETRMAAALGWFDVVEGICSRFDPESEVMRLTARAGVPVVASPLLFPVIQFALAVAAASGGAFDPTVGAALEARGFNRQYRTGQVVVSARSTTQTPTYRDVLLDAAARTVTVRKPLILDLGAVAKGLAIDLAVRELTPLTNCVVDAGGDLAVRGRNADGEPWRVGIRHPREDGALIASVPLADAAICTSGDYERRSPHDAAEHHLLDPRSRHSPAGVASVTVIAPTAMAADALSTAAFVLGPRDGLRLLQTQAMEGLIFTPTLDRYATAGFPRGEP